MPRAITLPDVFKPRQYQRDFLDTAVELLETQPETPHLFSSPTSTGKTWMQLMLLERLSNGVCITPRLEIIAGFLSKLGHYVEDSTDDQLTSLSWEYGITTPIRLRNMLAKGELTYRPTFILKDECHHDEADSWKDIDMYLNGVPQVGLTATPFRGTPKGTASFLDKWNNTINQVLSLEDAVRMGFYHVPEPQIWPMIDDDVIDVSGGEFRIKSLEAVVNDRAGAIAAKCEQFYSRRGLCYDMPTMMALPSTASVMLMQEELTRLNLPSVVVIQSTRRKDRQAAFQACVDSRAILLQIDVVSEGVDLPIRRIIDVASTMSPVRWMQRTGRIRPTDTGIPPQYICCNRNLERHGYLMEGLLPTSTFIEAQNAFEGKPSKRAGSRGVGLEGMGKFKAIPMKLANGVVVSCYSLTSVDSFTRKDFFVIVHPAHMETVQGVREMRKNPDGTVDWRSGKWKLIPEIPDLQGFASGKPYPLTEKQENKWKQLAEYKGLNPNVLPDARSIQVLFFLLDTGASFATR
jgi:hypothetical protein